MENISPTPQQSQAIRSIVDWYKSGSNEFYLAGYAGVGKSTIAAIAIEEIKDKCDISKVYTAAYTGKAANVLRKKGNKKAQTIHSLIYTPKLDEDGRMVFTLSEESDAAKADLIVLDECSMVDQKMADDLRSFGKKILVMGDPAQLPPVGGQGAFTSREPDVFLKEIHRQAADSPILELATLVRQGKPLPRGFHRGDVKVLPLTKGTQGMVYSPDTQPICGLNRVRWTYNQRIRTQRGFSGTLPQVGEKVICCKNDRKEGLFNGGQGIVLNVGSRDYNDAIFLDVQMDDSNDPHKELETDPVLFNNHFNGGLNLKLQVPNPYALKEFDFGYIITCHKAQGSQWDHVTVVDDSRSFRDTRANWLYTAITRAETGLTILTRD